jgi:hypothetical protein
MKKNRIRFFKFSDGKQNLQFHWPNIVKARLHLQSSTLLLMHVNE